MLLRYQPLRSDHCMTKTIDDGKESREKIHRNWTKEKMSITHGQLPYKYRIGQCPKII